MAPVRVGFVGFGEVGPVLSEALRKSGADIIVYDILLSQHDGEEIIRKRIRADGIRIGSLSEVVANSEYILSTVTTQVAKAVAKTCAKYLKPGHLYVDLNSTSPAVKVEIGRIIGDSGADFVEGAILGAVGATGSRTPILTAGERGRETAETLRDLGLNVSCYSSEIGKASTFKMLRSIFSKGLECLVLELLILGKRAGIEKDLWEEITQLMDRNPFDRVASNWVQTHAVAYERRYHEMVQVLETVQEIGVQPIMTSAAKTFFERSLSLRLSERFHEKPLSRDEVVDYMANQLKENSIHGDGNAATER